MLAPARLRDTLEIVGHPPAVPTMEKARDSGRESNTEFGDTHALLRDPQGLGHSRIRGHPPIHPS